MESHQSLFEALYCEEEHWDNFNGCLVEGEGDSELATSVEHRCDLWELDEELKCLVQKEQELEPYTSSGCGCECVCRDEAVEWMVRVTVYYSFSALTAVLAVNYLDRFLLHGFHSNCEEKPWMTQLAAVACLSLAAKVEETQVPLLLDLQEEESKFVFESKTIQRMEILVLSTLKWKMNPITPLSFVDHIGRRLGLKRELMRRCESLLLSLVSECRMMWYSPSAMATAAMLYVISSEGLEYQDQLFTILGPNKEKVEDCCRVIEKMATSYKKRKYGSSSPTGVVEVCFSCDETTYSQDSRSSDSPQSKKLKPSITNNID